jgi:hypothetical protein
MCRLLVSLLCAGDSYSVFELGSVCFTVVVVISNIRIAVATHFHHWFYQLAVAASVISWIAAAFFFDIIDADRMRGGMQRIFGSAAFWVSARSWCFLRMFCAALTHTHSFSLSTLRAPSDPFCGVCWAPNVPLFSVPVCPTRVLDGV